MLKNISAPSKIALFFIIHTFLCFRFLQGQKSLSELANEYQTDKGSAHNYIPAYDFYFSSLRNRRINFLEIGFFVGNSARMWDQYFPRANLHFIDIVPEFLEKYAHGLSSRCHFHIVDQANKEDLLKFIEKVGIQFDVILDDGGHKMNQQITSFITLFPYVKSGGIYIIEDLHTSYWSSFGGSGEIGNPKTNQDSTIYFLQSLIHDVNFIGATTGYADKALCSESIRKNLTYYQRHIRSIHFYSSLCFIIKE